MQHCMSVVVSSKTSVLVGLFIATQLRVAEGDCAVLVGEKTEVLGEKSVSVTLCPTRLSRTRLGIEPGVAW